MFGGNTRKQQPDVVADKLGSIPRTIEIRFIPHSHHRYPTIGDYYESGQIGLVKLEVSKMEDRRYEFLIAIHELVEMCLVDVAGIAFGEIDKFDMSRTLGDEPGMESDCPYRLQHLIATSVEMQVAAAMGVDWAQYEGYLGNL